MRIAHVSDCYLPRTGGIETQVRSLALAQTARGDDVRILTASPGHDGVRAGSDTVDGLPVERIAMALPGEIPIHLRTRAKVVEALAAHPVDVVHVHAGVVSPFAWGAIRAAHQLDLPTVITVHSVWGPLARPAFRGVDALSRWSSWGVVLTAVSEVAAARIRRSVPVPVGVLPNGIDPLAWRGVPGQWEAEAGSLRIVSVLRMAPRKRVGPLVQVIARAHVLLGPDVRVRACLIGDGPERVRAQRLARRLGLEVEFTGTLPPEAIRDRFATADVFVQASVRESFGIAALEARTFGLPVVARRQSGTGEFVADGINGLLALDDAGLARGLADLGHHPEILASMRAFNETHEPEQTWPHVCDRAQAFYRLAGARGA